MPRFVQWQQQYAPQGLQILGVSIDDDDSEVKPFVSQLHVNYPVMMGDARLGRLYGGVLGAPITFLIDRHGIIRDRLEGEQDLDRLERKIQQLLRQ
jgi:peroxiredoxin